MSRKARLGLPLLAVALPLLVALPGFGQEEFYQRGNQLYQDGDFDGAIEAYLAVLQAGFENADLHYNLGNAYFKAGKLGPSILSYERAIRLDPRDPDIQANLDLARSLTADAVEPLPRFWVLSALEWWVDLLPRGGLLLLVILLYFAGAAGLGLRILSRPSGPRRFGTWVAAAAGPALLLFGATFLAREGILGRTDWGIIMAEEVAVQSAPATEADLTLFRLHEGTRVRVDQRTEKWTEVVLEDGKVGWVPSEVLETI